MHSLAAIDTAINATLLFKGQKSKLTASLPFNGYGLQWKLSKVLRKHRQIRSYSNE